MKMHTHVQEPGGRDAARRPLGRYRPARARADCGQHLLERSGLLDRLDPDTLLYGDKASQKLHTLWDAELVVVPRKKPRDKPRPSEDAAYNRPVARERIVVEHTIRRVRCYQTVPQTDRHHRHGHGARMQAVEGLINRQIGHWCAA